MKATDNSIFTHVTAILHQTRSSDVIWCMELWSYMTVAGLFKCCFYQWIMFTPAMYSIRNMLGHVALKINLVSSLYSVRDLEGKKIAQQALEEVSK